MRIFQGLRGPAGRADQTDRLVTELLLKIWMLRNANQDFGHGVSGSLRSSKGGS